MRLVPNARRAWRWFSMQLLALAAAAQVAWETLPPEALALIPVDVRGYITLGLVVAAMVGRLVDQGSAKPYHEPDALQLVGEDESYEAQRRAALKREPDRDFRQQPIPSAPPGPPPPKPTR